MSNIVSKDEMYKWASDLFPINRSLTGAGTLTTLKYIQQILPDLKIHSVPSGTEAFDWTVPEEWNISEAWIKDPQGRIIVNFQDTNLHVMGYSEPVHQKMSLEDLQKHLYSLPDQPNAIPYVTSYYKRRWGFCLTEDQRKTLAPGQYEVFIDSTLGPGVMNYGELIIKGQTDEEILISTYVCHPSMANNELSGPVVTTAIGKWIQGLKNRRYTYRLIFIPETIGSILYLSKHVEYLKKHVIAGFVLTCIGDTKTYSYLESRNGNTLADRVVKHVLKYHAPDYVHYTFLERGSDERQYCSPGIDLPVCDIMRTKYGKYDEYHTSLDNMDFISPAGLQGGYEVVRKSLILLEANCIITTNTMCEPQLGKRGLYPTVSTKDPHADIKRMMNMIAYSDGTRDLFEIAEKINENAIDLLSLVDTLVEHKVLKKLPRRK